MLEITKEEINYLVEKAESNVSYEAYLEEERLEERGDGFDEIDRSVSGEEDLLEAIEATRISAIDEQIAKMKAEYNSSALLRAEAYRDVIADYFQVDEAA